jgi:lactate racemase
MTGALQTAAWYGDRPLGLTFPDHWNVTTWWPDTPPALTDDQIVEALERPTGQAPIRELARGAERPTIIVDDLTRPTPAARVLPFVLRQLADAGLPADMVRIVVATGSHAWPSPDGVLKKVGREAAACQLLVHDCSRNLIRVGRTSFGTPVLVNRDVLAADLLIGIGGIYPQHSAGFGGGSKLILGVLGKRSIIALHYRHPSMSGSYDIRNDMRRDLDEIAHMVGLRTSISLHVDAQRQAVRIASGDHQRYYDNEVACALQAYRAPIPADADLVISNAYPIDVSLTFMRSKGIIPLLHARPGASKVLIAACSEGSGHHGLFPFVNRPRFQNQLHLARKARARPTALPARSARFASRRLKAALGRRGAATATVEPHRQDGPDGRHPTNPIWLYTPGRPPGSLPAEIPGMRIVHAWTEVLAQVGREQLAEEALEVSIYPCAPLQVLASPRAKLGDG